MYVETKVRFNLYVLVDFECQPIIMVFNNCNKQNIVLNLRMIKITLYEVTLRNLKKPLFSFFTNKVLGPGLGFQKFEIQISVSFGFKDLHTMSSS